MGSPLATHFIRRRLQGAGREAARRISDERSPLGESCGKGDTTALYPRLEPFFRPMVELGLLESFEDSRGPRQLLPSDHGLNAHEAYGYLAAPRTAEIVGDWLQRSMTAQ